MIKSLITTLTDIPFQKIFAFVFFVMYIEYIKKRHTVLSHLYYITNQVKSFFIK